MQHPSRRRTNETRSFLVLLCSCSCPARRWRPRTTPPRWRCDEEAIYEDYLADPLHGRRDEAPQGACRCATGRPTARTSTRARLHCDLGVIEFALDNPKEGREQFASAVHKDPKRRDRPRSVEARAREGARRVQGAAVAERRLAAAAGRRLRGRAGAGRRARPTALPGSRAARRSNGSRRSAARGGRAGRRALPAQLVQPRLSGRRAAPSFGEQRLRRRHGVHLLRPRATTRTRPLAGADDVVNGGVEARHDARPPRLRPRPRGELHGRREPRLRLQRGTAAPGRAAPSSRFHAEARASYWFGHAPLARAGLRFFVTGAIGIQEVDASIPVDIYPTTAAYQAGQSQNYSGLEEDGPGFAADRARRHVRRDARQRDRPRAPRPADVPDRRRGRRAAARLRDGLLIASGIAADSLRRREPRRRTRASSSGPSSSPSRCGSPRAPASSRPATATACSRPATGVPFSTRPAISLPSTHVSMVPAVSSKCDSMHVHAFGRESDALARSRRAQDRQRRVVGLAVVHEDHVLSAHADVAALVRAVFHREEGHVARRRAATPRRTNTRV